jgi:carbamate kinase
VKIVAALGGNALLERGEPPESDVQEAHVVKAVQALAPLALENELVITHGNGPQVGMLAMQSAHDRSVSRPYPFDVLGAQTQGMIGYWLIQALQNAVPGRHLACLVSRTLVRQDDPAFSRPSKFVGPVYDEQQARVLAASRCWQVRQDGSGWRRVVPSPEPVELLDLPIIRILLGSRAIVICAGGGGVPVVRDGAGMVRGVEAVVDKDLTASLLARELHSDALLLLTDVEAVQDGYGTSQARPIRQATPAQLRSRSFPAGSMGPKIEAVCRFVEATGQMAAIGRLSDAQALLAREAGTIIAPSETRESAGLVLLACPADRADGWGQRQPQADRHDHGREVAERPDTNVAGDDPGKDHQHP